jgi:hypothetical protein
VQQQALAVPGTPSPTSGLSTPAISVGDGVARVEPIPEPVAFVALRRRSVLVGVDGAVVTTTSSSEPASPLSSAARRMAVLEYGAGLACMF